MLLAGPALATEIGEIDVRALPPEKHAHAANDRSSLWLETKTRMTAMLIDPAGRRLGVEATTYKVVKGIPGADCTADFVANPYTGDEHAEAYERMTIAPALKGVYKLQLHGLQTGPYEISAAALSRDGSSEPSKSLEGMISEGEDQTLELNFDPAPHATLSWVDTSGQRP